MYWLTGITGFFMMAAPYLFNYSGNPIALWTSIIAGLIVIAASLGEAAEHDRASWEYWVAGFVGIFAVIAPFIFNFGEATAIWTTVIAGGIIAIIAGSRLWIGGPRRAF